MGENATPVADATPSKELFVDLLTRDITLSECILDLIDNSIHSLVANEKLDVMNHLISRAKVPAINRTVEITISPSRFYMEDDCGGITLENAEHHAFLLGKPASSKKSTGLGVYGIGMKRAFFKIGRQILVKSKTTKEEFEVPIDVAAWKAEPKRWYFPIENIKKRVATSGSFSLKIDDLTDQAKSHFTATAFRKILEDKIALAYALFIQAGLTITLNGNPIASNMPQIAESNVLNSVRHYWTTNGVDILILAGLTPKKFSKPGGWYIFCNGRMVLEADKTERTGWGTGEFPGFHPKYNRFLGIVYFRSKDLLKLPWTTTKEGVVLENHAYQEALSEMEVLSRPILNLLRDSYGPDPQENQAQREMFDQTKPVNQHEIARRQNTTFKAKLPPKKDDDLVNIQFQRPRKKIQAIAKALGNSRMSAVRVGEATFDDFYERNC